MAEVKWIGSTSTDPTNASNWSTGSLPGTSDSMVFDGTAQASCQFNGTFPPSVASVHDVKIASDWNTDYQITTGGASVINVGGFLSISAANVINASHSLTFDFIGSASVTAYVGDGGATTSAFVNMGLNSGSVFTSDTSRGNTTFDFNATSTTMVDGVYPKLTGTGIIKTKKIYSDASRTAFNTYGSVDMWTITGDLKFESEKYDIYDYEKVFLFEGGFTALGENFKFGHTTAKFITYRSAGTGSVVFPVTGELNSAAFGNDTTKVFNTQYHKVVIEANDNKANYWLVSDGKVLECNELVINDGGRFYANMAGNNSVVIRCTRRPTVIGDWNFRQVTEGIYESIGGTNVLPVTHGGTGLTTVAPGAILYGDGQGNLVVLSPGGNGTTLTISGGVPVWS